MATERRASLWLTKFEYKEQQRVKEDYRALLREVTPLEQGAGGWAD
jgi:hypothetical protein